MLLQFLGNILCEGVVVQQSADCEILQGILRQIKILRLIRELRRGLVLGIALFCLLRIVRRLRLIFAAPGENAEQQNKR